MKAYYLFGKSKLPEELSEEIRSTVERLKKLETKEQILKEAYKEVTTRYSGGKVATFLKLYNIVSSGAEDLWNRSGFMHCTNQNYLLTILLVKSGSFAEEDIKPKWTLLYGFSPHQFLKVKTNDRYIDVDAWARTYGIKFGDHAHGLHVGPRV